jgi:hypothetical protein
VLTSTLTCRFPHKLARPLLPEHLVGEPMADALDALTTACGGPDLTGWLQPAAGLQGQPLCASLVPNGLWLNRHSYYWCFAAQVRFVEAADA